LLQLRKRGMKSSKIIVLFAAFFLASGASLLVYIFSGFSLLLSLVLAIAMIAVTWTIVWQKMDQTKQGYIKQRVKAGIVAGFLATAVYDLSRFALIKITGIHFWPFDIFDVFGKSLLGPSVEGWWVSAVGVGFHFLNGIAFGTSYAILFGTRGALAGVIWALMLETLMVVAYPRWLTIKFMEEFLQVSIFGHIMYGTTLGYLAKKFIPLRPAERGFGGISLPTKRGEKMPRP